MPLCHCLIFGYLITLEIMYLLIVFLPLLGSFVAGCFGRFLGKEGSNGYLLILFGIIVLSCIFLFRRYSFHLKEKYGVRPVLILYISLFFGISFFFSLIRIYVYSRVGMMDLTPLFPLVLSVGTGQGLPLPSPSDPPSESSWSGSWINSYYGNQGEASSSLPNLAAPHAAQQNLEGEGSSAPGAGGNLDDAVRPFLRAEGAGPQNPMGIQNPPNRGVGDPVDVFLANQDAFAEWEQGARDGVYQAVAGIGDACSQEQDHIVEKARTLLARKGIILDDPQDVNRAVDIAMTEEWDKDNLDLRLSHFRNLYRYLGTRNCRLWPEILKELRGLGNLDVPDGGE